jgi:hypothetical protein
MLQSESDFKYRISGVLIGLIWFLFNFFNSILNSNQSIYLMVNQILIVGLIIIFIIFGFMVGKATKHIKHTIVIGLAASFIGAICGLILLFLATYLFFDIFRNNLSAPINLYSISPSNNRYVLEDILGSSFFMTVFGLLFGAVAGGIGGSVGAHNSK